VVEARTSLMAEKGKTGLMEGLVGMCARVALVPIQHEIANGLAEFPSALANFGQGSSGCS
jgi:hypothetical protein